VTLEFNVTKTSTWLNNSAVRAAISAGVNRTALSVKGESGYEAPATSLSALILPSQSSYLASQYKNDISAVNQPKTVKSILT
jgi:ABC-type transport system substrate-binding protein